MDTYETQRRLVSNLFTKQRRLADHYQFAIELGSIVDCENLEKAIDENNLELTSAIAKLNELKPAAMFEFKSNLQPATVKEN